MRFPWHTLALIACASWLAACGARSGLSRLGEDTDGAVEGPVASSDGGAPDTGTPVARCMPRWDLCRTTAGPLLVSGSELGQYPDPVWADEQLLVVYDGDAGGNMVSQPTDLTHPHVTSKAR